MTPEQRRLRARIAAHARWSRPSARADQADAARSAIKARLERQVDPSGALPPDQRAALARSAARRLGAQLNAARARKRASTGIVPTTWRAGASGLMAGRPPPFSVSRVEEWMHR